MIKEKIEKHKIAIGISFILVLILVATITFIFMSSKPYKKYDDDIYMYYSVERIENVPYYIIRSNPSTVKLSYPIEEIGVWKKDIQFYFKIFDENTLTYNYKKAFVVNIYFYNGSTFIRLNEVSKKIPNLSITKYWR